MLRRRWIEAAWGAFALTNVAVIIPLSRWETIPFHLVWVSLTLVYGFRRWRVRTTMAVLGSTIAITAGALAWSIARGHEGPDELAEVPLMAAMFLAMMWHAERRQAAVETNQRLAESERRLRIGQREFVRDASHELRTPITVARGHLELIRASTGDPQVSEDARIVLDELERLSALSERMLLLTTASHPDFLSKRPIEIDELIGELSTRWIPTATRRWLLRIDAHGEIDADPDRLGSALDGLVENAIAATDEGGTVEIACAGEGSTLSIRIADDGRGIPPGELGRVFDRFTRVGNDRGRGRGGTGLGLAITKAVVEAHGGRIGIESESNRGTTVRIELDGFRPRTAPLEDEPTMAPTSVEAGRREEEPSALAGDGPHPRRRRDLNTRGAV